MNKMIKIVADNLSSTSSSPTSIWLLLRWLLLAVENLKSATANNFCRVWRFQKSATAKSFRHFAVFMWLYDKKNWDTWLLSCWCKTFLLSCSFCSVSIERTNQYDLRWAIKNKSHNCRIRWFRHLPISLKL